MTEEQFPTQKKFLLCPVLFTMNKYQLQTLIPKADPPDSSVDTADRHPSILRGVSSLSQIRLAHQRNVGSRFSFRFKDHNPVLSLLQKRSWDIQSLLWSLFPETADVCSVYQHTAFSPSIQGKKGIGCLFCFKNKIDTSKCNLNSIDAFRYKLSRSL